MKYTLAAITLLSVFLSYPLAPAFAEPVIYVAAGSANKVIAIDAKTNEVIGEFTGIDNPHSLVATPDGEYLIAGSLKVKPKAEGETGSGESTIYIIHPAHGHVMSTMAAVGTIHHQAITPDGRYVISTHPTQGGISYADLVGEGGVETLKTGNGPNYTAITADGSKAYVTNSGSNNISEIDIGNWTVTRSLEAGPGPEHLVLSRDESKLFTINARAGKISEIDVVSGKVTRNWELGKGAHGLDISEDGNTLFATAKGRGVLVAIDLATDAQREMALSPEPYHLEVLPGTGKVYVSSRNAPKIWVIDPTTWKLDGEIDIDGEGHQMTLIDG